MYTKTSYNPKNSTVQGENVKIIGYVPPFYRVAITLWKTIGDKMKIRLFKKSYLYVFKFNQTDNWNNLLTK